jgi:hypothetical protein
VRAQTITSASSLMQLIASTGLREPWFGTAVVSLAYADILKLATQRRRPAAVHIVVVAIVAWC